MELSALLKLNVKSSEEATFLNIHLIHCQDNVFVSWVLRKKDIIDTIFRIYICYIGAFVDSKFSLSRCEKRLLYVSYLLFNFKILVHSSTS